MPTIEVLPNSTSISAPGWAYVPDTGYDPSKAAIQPSARKRAARASNLGGNITNDTRQANAILKHIAELDRESSKDVQIKGSVGAGRKDKKMTTNVRRILTSNKTFANHLADEEAWLAGMEQGAGGSTSRPRALTGGTRRASTAATSPPPPQGARRSVTASTPTPTASMSAVQSDPEDDPLLKTYMPAPPSAAEMEALVSAPPLSYNQSRAAPSVGRPQRYFCEMCGYWGSVRCMKCGARVCGLDCKLSHDEGRCLRY